MPLTAKDTDALVVHCPGLLAGGTITRLSHQLIKDGEHAHTRTHMLVQAYVCVYPDPMFVYHNHIKGIRLVAES